MSTSQKEAVVAAVTDILGDSFVSGETVVKDIITKDQLTTLRDNIFEGISAGTIAFKGDSSDPSAVRRYVNGMIDNHFRKAKELNGGSKYSVKNSSGSRGSSDPTLKALRQLSKNYAPGSAELNRIQTAISEREQALANERNAAKASQKKSATLKNIDMSVLPPELTSLINS